VVADDVGTDLDLQRFLRGELPSANDSNQEAAQALPYLPAMLNLELHRRKIFWVDPALSYMLESTDVDLPGSELRAPFPAFALAFTDRHALSLGERLLACKTDDPHCGHLLRVITVYVTEEHGIEGRFLSVTFAFDALGADLPSLKHREVPTGSEASVRAFLESVGPNPAASPDLPDRHPLRGLLRLVINAILYATSAGVAPEVRKVPAKKGSTRGVEPSSDSVYYLPGKIDIRGVRQLQKLQRAPGGRQMVSRFMVRGHWRRPLKNWTDQRLRWIEPYWKGPELAAAIEKAYRLKPSSVDEGR